MIASFTKYFLPLFLFITSFASGQTNSRSLADDPTVFRQYVTDETGTLSREQINSLNQKLREHEKATSNQVVVYMIPSLGNESLEDISIRLAEKNLIGQKGKDNGVLFLIVKDDRKMRIEVGYGLEGVLTDALSSQIIRNEVAPEFRNGNFYKGINAGVDAIIAAIKGEYKADEDDDGELGPGISCCFGLPLLIVVIFGFIFFMIFISILQRIFGFGGRHVSGGKRSSSGFWGGGFGGGSGSSFGGGGFSGGGGSFGGGGASGSW